MSWVDRVSKEESVKKKNKTRNPMAGVLSQVCFRKQVVRSRKAHTRKGRAAAKQFVGGSFSCRVILYELDDLLGLVVCTHCFDEGGFYIF
jgi:hypothetical protein